MKRAVLAGYKGNLGPIFTRALEKDGYRVEKIGLPGRDLSKKFEVDFSFHPPEIIIINAGVDNVPGKSGNQFWDWEEFLIPNFAIAINVTRAYLPMVLEGKQKCHFIYIGSVLGSVAADHRNYSHGFDKSCGYGASKAAIRNLIKNLTARYSEYDVRFNQLSFGPFDNGNHDPDFQKKFVNNIPLGRMLSSDDIEGALTGMLRQTAMTGTELLIDGGYTSR